MDVGSGADGGVYAVLQRPEAAHRPLHSGGHLQVRAVQRRQGKQEEVVKQTRLLKSCGCNIRGNLPTV